VAAVGATLFALFDREGRLTGESLRAQEPPIKQKCARLLHHAHSGLLNLIVALVFSTGSVVRAPVHWSVPRRLDCPSRSPGRTPSGSNTFPTQTP